MVELLVTCFEIDGYAEHEMGIFSQPKTSYEIFCSKAPRDVRFVGPLLKIDKNLWVIHMVRDPRDVVVSRHKKDPSKYWANLRIWQSRRSMVRKASKHPRFLTVRYEDLVREPQAVQQRLIDNMPFLKKRADFRDFHKTANPSDRSLEALGSLRPISTASIGAWRQHKPRVAAQLAMHGPIDDELIKYGYEEDTSWHQELEGVVPDNGESHWPDHGRRGGQLKRKIQNYRMMAGYAKRVLFNS